MQGNFARIWQGIVIAQIFCIVMSNSSQSHDDAAPTVTLSKEWVIKKSGSKKIWNPDIQEKDGIKFVKLHKFDRQLTYFCLNASLDTRAGKNISCNTKTFDAMIELRRVASEKAVHDALAFQPDLHDDQPDPAVKKGKKTRGERGGQGHAGNSLGPS